jgi:hypothetical protein
VYINVGGLCGSTIIASIDLGPWQTILGFGLRGSLVVYWIGLNPVQFLDN